MPPKHKVLCSATGVAVAAPKHAGNRRLGRFCAVGLLGTAVYYPVLWALVELSGVPVLAATSIAFLLVCLENYILHYVWTFGSTRSHTTAFPRFLFMSLVGFCINWVVMFLGVEKLAQHYLLIQAFAIAAVVAWNFMLSSYWVFHDAPGHN